MYEIPSLNKDRKVEPKPENPNEFPVDLLFVSGNTELSERFTYTADLILTETYNVDSFEVYINGDYVGENLSKIQINTNDLVRFVATKDSSGEAKIFTTAKLI